MTTTKKQAAARGHQSAATPKRRVSAAEVQAKTETPRTVDGIRLIRRIRKELINRDLPERHISDLMGVTQIYWNSICNGNRSITALKKDKLQIIAEFLDIPLIQVEILADRLDAHDFFRKKTLNDELEASFVKMLEDKLWGTNAASIEREWPKMSVNAKLMIVLLYERECGKVLLQRAQVETPELVGKK